MKKGYMEPKRKGVSYIQSKEERKANWIGHILRRNCLVNKLLKER
jgi:hypothetical protein